MATVYSYIRFSSKPQEKGHSLKRQRDLAEAWLAKHPEHILDTTLRMSDLAKSAFRGANLDPEQGDLGKFIWLAQHDKKRVPTGSILLLERLDRFSRDDALKAVNVLTGLILAGVTVVTLEPERTADRKTGGKMEVLLPMVMDLIIANEYSANISFRVGKAWAAKRQRAAAGECKLTSCCPAWLRLVDGEFHVIPERVKVLKDIYRWAEQGMGTDQIAKRLNSAGVPTWGRSKLWARGYIIILLRTRRVLGEYQRHTRDGKPIGDPILGYYKEVIKETQFDRVQREVSARFHQRGRQGKCVTNLFTRLINDACDGSPMHIGAKGSRGKARYKPLVFGDNYSFP